MFRRIPMADTAALLALLISLSATPAAAQAGGPPLMSVGGAAGTLGLGVQVGLRPTRGLGVRGSYATFSWDGTQEVEGNEYNLSPRVRHAAVLVDLHPGGGAFRLSGGLVRLGSVVEATATADGTIGIGEEDYTIAEIGALRARGEYPEKLKPYAGLGFGGSGRIGLTLDLGLVFSGYPTVSLSTDATLPPADQAELESNLREEEASINQSIQDTGLAKYYPVLMLGLVIRF